MSNVVHLPEPKCPDCGAWWPRSHDRCPACLLSTEELQIASDFLDDLERLART